VRDPLADIKIKRSSAGISMEETDASDLSPILQLPIAKVYFAGNEAREADETRDGE